MTLYPRPVVLLLSTSQRVLYYSCNGNFMFTEHVFKIFVDFYAVDFLVSLKWGCPHGENDKEFCFVTVDFQKVSVKSSIPCEIGGTKVSCSVWPCTFGGYVPWQQRLWAAQNFCVIFFPKSMKFMLWILLCSGIEKHFQGLGNEKKKEVSHWS